jgi:hypothetical protein
MLDIATGRPATSYAIRELQNTGFLTTLLSSMTVNILPRHLSFGALIYLIHFYVRIGPNTHHSENKILMNTYDMGVENTVRQAGFIDKLPHNIRSEPQLLQAQEHYLSVTTELGQELILYKFGQAIREMPDDYGMQVHRSFWVAKNNIRGWSVMDNGVKILLHYGRQAPVSRRFEHYIKQHFVEINE